MYTTIRIAIYCNTLQQNGNILQYSFCCIVTPLMASQGTLYCLTENNIFQNYMKVENACVNEDFNQETAIVFVCLLSKVNNRHIGYS
jgi:hypothetical protein